jgi:hypothetical protein
MKNELKGVSKFKGKKLRPVPHPTDILKTKRHRQCLATQHHRRDRYLSNDPFTRARRVDPDPIGSGS